MTEAAVAGRPGRSGGHNRISIEEHIRRGTFNPTRHGKRAARAAAVTVTAPFPVPPALVEGLTGRGRAFVDECWVTYGGWTPATSVLLREAGLLIDELETLRGQRGERAAQRLLLSAIAALQLRE
jgi:hypothetical protein